MGESRDGSLLHDTNFNSTRAIPIQMSDIRFRCVQNDMQDTQLCYGTDVISTTCGVSHSVGCATNHRANANPHTRISINDEKRSRRRNKFEFPMPPVKFPYQCPDYICITVHGRPTTEGRRETTSALVKMRESARCSLLLPE